ncbi:hypothetical protein [Streptomyces sp. HNM1019]|uniref:hypothetical protein n=1 Tax=Streptomyces sp. HNM1019 TaxID=3424717 RepID=UPI003D76B94E
MSLFQRDPEKAAARIAQRKEARAEAERRRQVKQEEKDRLRAWRAEHPAEPTLNRAAMPHLWAKSEYGQTHFGPVAGGSAEFFNAGAHKAWTATRLVGGAMTLGASAALTGRKNKGAAAINVTFGNGAVQSWTVKPDATALKAANQYVLAFNALAQQLVAEGQQKDPGTEK